MEEFTDHAWLIDWLNGVLRHFKQYFSHITATANIIHAFLGLTSTERFTDHARTIRLMDGWTQGHDNSSEAFGQWS